MTPQTQEQKVRQLYDELRAMGHRPESDYSLGYVAHYAVSYSDQQTASKDKEISELKSTLSELIQVKDWKDKHGKDEHYLKAMPIAWENVRKLIHK